MAGSAGGGRGRGPAPPRRRVGLVRRRRSGGPPIPMIYCVHDGWQPVPEEQLPVRLPLIDNFRPTGTGQSPLAAVATFVNTICPLCGQAARRVTDVSANFLGSAWYFLRYLLTDFYDRALARRRVKQWPAVAP